MSHETKEFEANGDFGAYYAACEWLKQNGFSYGSMQRADPMGIMKGDWDIAKWRNLSVKDKKSLDGDMLFARGDKCTVSIKTDLMPK